MNLKKRFFENFNLYAITNIEREHPDILVQIDQAYKGGAGIVQLRSKTLSDREMIRIGVKIREVARIYGKAFVVNDRVAVALAINADAVHLGQDDLPVAFAHELIRACDSPMLIGKSTHSLSQAQEAEEEGADYIGVGPIFETPTKPSYAAVGLDLLHLVRSKVRLPAVAIGGIDENNIDKVLDAGAKCIAVVRAIFSSQEPYEAARKLRQKYDQFHQQYVS